MATHVVNAEQLERELAELLEVEKFPPPEGFREHALVNDWSLHKEADRDFEAFWARQADELRKLQQELAAERDRRQRLEQVISEGRK